MATPAYLFRTYSPESGGYNTSTWFKPVRATHPAPTAVTFETNRSALAKALKWEHAPDFPFIFWTDSLLNAILYALWKYHREAGRNHVQIVCLNTATATTCAGRPARFMRMADLARKYDVFIKPGWHSRELANKGCVKSGPDSFVINVTRLIKQGLYTLYPELKENRNTTKLKWRITYMNAVDSWFVKPELLTNLTLDLAIRLAGAAKPVYPQDESISHAVLAAILSFRKRSGRDQVLLSYVEQERDYNSIGHEHNFADIEANDDVATFQQLESLLRRNVADENRFLISSPALSASSVGKL